MLLRTLVRVCGLILICVYVPMLVHNLVMACVYAQGKVIGGVFGFFEPATFQNFTGAAIGMYLLFRGRALVNRLEPAGFPRCPECGYNLTGLGHARRCPECGWPIPDELRPEQGPPS